jgi:hypothetical protein
MAEFTGPNYRTLQANGEYGNARVAILQYTCAGEASGSVLLLGQIPGGARIHSVTLRNAALGTGVTLSVGTRYLDSTEGTGSATAFTSATVCTSAARTVSSADVVEIAKGKGVEIIATTGVGAATGAISVIVEYDWPGQ